MPLEIGVWRVDGQPRRMPTSAIPLEARLEELLETDPTILGEPLLLIGRQVPTAHGKFIDLLAVDSEGVLHVLELKRDKTPRDVVAQTLDYGSWVETLAHDDVRSIFERYRDDVAFEEAFFDRFATAPPEELNSGHMLTVVASEVDPATARIVEYLARFDVPLNVVFFRYFVDDGHEYLARTWLVDDTRGDSGEGSAKKSRAGKRQPWNGQDWYVSFGEESGIRSWDDARRYGFVSAGGGAWYSRTIRNLPIGARVFVCIPGGGAGYVGVGTTTGEAMPFDEAVLTVDGVETKMAELPLKGSYRHDNDADDNAEYVVPVAWIGTNDRSEAIWEKGFFANQNSACKFRDRFTLDELVRRFDLGE
ncbi:MAG: endonuclease NucS domain-containing protein [Nocardioidaceae bacterium]